MIERGLECVGQPVDELGESPVWVARDAALYRVDLRRRLVHRWQPASGASQSWSFDEWVGAVVPVADGRLAVALASGVVLFDVATARMSPLVAPEPANSGNRLNDSKCDRQGRLWTGSMRDYGAAPSGALYRVDATCAATRMLDGLRVPNALCWSPDDRAMYFADSADGVLRAYAFDAIRGELGAMRVLLDAGSASGKPDGATVDADGCVWNARYGGGCVVRVTPAGRIDRVVRLPVSQPTSCAFGGADLRTLYITTARQRLSPAQLAAEPLAGAVFALATTTPGIAEPAYRNAAD